MKLARLRVKLLFLYSLDKVCHFRSTKTVIFEPRTFRDNRKRVRGGILQSLTIDKTGVCEEWKQRRLRTASGTGFAKCQSVLRQGVLLKIGSFLQGEENDQP